MSFVVKNAGTFIGVVMAARQGHVTSPVSMICSAQLRRLIRPNKHGKRCLRCLDGTNNHPPLRPTRHAKAVAKKMDRRQSSTNVEINTIVLRCARIGVLMDRVGDAEVAIDGGSIKGENLKIYNCR